MSGAAYMPPKTYTHRCWSCGRAVTGYKYAYHCLDCDVKWSMNPVLPSRSLRSPSDT